jgi:hypothetical protein
MLTDVWPRFLVSEEFKALSARKELRMLGLDALMAPPTPAPKPRAETVLFLSSHNKRRPWADAWSPLPERRERRRKTPAAAAAANSSSVFSERQFNSAPGRSAPGSTTVSAPTSPQRDGAEARKGVTFSSGTFASVRPPSPVSIAATAPASPNQQAAAAAAAAAAGSSDSSAVMGATTGVAAASESADAAEDDDCGDESDPVFGGSNPMDAPVSLESIVFAGTAAVSAQ